MRVSFSNVLNFHGWMVVVLAAALCGGSAAAADEPQGRGGLFGEGFNALERVLDSQSRLVFFWPKDHAGTEAATILINGTYHATLTVGGYSLLCMAPAVVRVGARLIGASGRRRDGVDMGAELELQPGQTVYFRVRLHDENLLTLESVQAARAREELNKTREQIHTLSRVTSAQACQDLGPRSSLQTGAGAGVSAR